MGFVVDLVKRHEHTLTPMFYKVAKGAIAGTCVAFALWAGQKGLSAVVGVAGCDDDAFAPEDSQALAYDPEVRELCRQLKKYGRFDGGALETIVHNWASVITLNARLQRGELAAKFSHPRIVASHIGNIVESVRTLRAVLKTHTKHEQVVAEFDELAASTQRMCNQYAFNITKMVECSKM